MLLLMNDGKTCREIQQFYQWLLRTYSRPLVWFTVIRIIWNLSGLAGNRATTKKSGRLPYSVINATLEKKRQPVRILGSGRQAGELATYLEKQGIELSGEQVRRILHTKKSTFTSGQNAAWRRTSRTKNKGGNRKSFLDTWKPRSFAAKKLQVWFLRSKLLV